MMPALHTDSAVPTLASIGLSNRADLVYRFLAGGGPRRVADIAGALGLSARAARTALEELADVGAVHDRSGRSGGAARTWAAVAPTTVAAEIRARQREAATAKDRVRRELAGPGELGLDPPAAEVRLISGASRIRRRVFDLIGAERHEHLVMNPDPVIDRAAVLAASPAHNLLVERKIAVKELGVPPGEGDGTADVMADLSRTVAQFRELPTVPTKFMVFDRSTALIRVSPADPERGVLEVSDPATVASLVDLFYRHWERGRPHRQAAGTPLTAREKAVVRLLAEGKTDATVAEELEVSRRTVTYTMQDLMRRLGVLNRFQLGMALSAEIQGQP